MSGTVMIEREYFRTLLKLCGHPKPREIVASAMQLLAEITDAIEVFVELARDGSEAVLALSHPPLDKSVHQRSAVCRELIERTLREQQIVEHVSAGNGEGGLSEVTLCVPITSAHLHGVVCVHRSCRRRSFSFREREHVGFLVQELIRCADGLLDTIAPRGSLHEALQRLQERFVEDALARTNGVVARAARELGVSRAFIYEVVRSAGLRRKA